MKKILIFSLAYAPLWGGAEVAIKEVTDRLAGEFSFDMITPRFNSALPKHERVGNINVYRIGPSKENPTDEELVRFPLYLAKVLYPPLAFLKACALYRRNRYDALWAMMAYAGFPVVFFRFIYPKVPYILTLQEGDPISHMTGRLRIRAVYPLLRRIFTEARAVSAISSYLADYARRMGFNGHVSVIPNGVDMKKFGGKASPEEKLALRRKIDVGEDDVLLITTSRLVPKNAVGDVIEALRLLPGDVKFLVLGTGPLLEELRSLSGSAGLSGRVRFLGHVPYAELPSYYSMADIFVRPSLSEGMGSSFIEAMASGIPVIGTLVGGITDFLKDKETGFVCGVNDPKGIARQVAFIVDPSNKRIVDGVVRRAREMVEERYDWGTIARATGRFFAEAI